VACLLALGLTRSGRAGRILGAALALVSAYLIAATYVVKLIPLYAGYAEGSIRPAQLLQWYRQDAWMDILADTAPGNSHVILWLAALVALSAAAICTALCRGLLAGEKARSVRMGR